MIESNVRALLAALSGGNCYGEKVTLVAATKTRTAEEIQCAIDAGIEAVAENRVQEFREKNGLLHGASRQFIGHLQLNKVKYLVGNVDLIQSVDRDELAAEISRLAVLRGVCQEILIQINIGREETKGGYPVEEGAAVFERLKHTGGLRPRGFMAMLPESEDEKLLGRLADDMRALFEEVKNRDADATCLSMGMSGDWRLCLRHGTTMIRLGTAIFGERNY